MTVRPFRQLTELPMAESPLAFESRSEGGVTAEISMKTVWPKWMHLPSGAAIVLADEMLIARNDTGGVNADS